MSRRPPRRGSGVGARLIGPAAVALATWAAAWAALAAARWLGWLGVDADAGGIAALGLAVALVAGAAAAAVHPTAPSPGAAADPPDTDVAAWREARLAAVVAAVGKGSHDLRGTLSPVLLSAERLVTHADEPVRRTGDMIVRAVDRAIELLRTMVEFTRESGAAPARTRFGLRALVAEAAGPALHPALRIDLPEGLELEAEREAVRRAFAHLLRRAAAAGARAVSVSVSISAAGQPPVGGFRIEVADDGAALSDPVRAQPFRPHGTEYDLAIARDLLRAGGGDIALLRSDAQGTVFALTLPARTAGRA